jgi:hypothetical protein
LEKSSVSQGDEMPEVRATVDSLASLEASLLELCACFDGEVMWWRGHADANWLLKPGAFREFAEGSPYDGSSLINHFKLRATGRLGYRPAPQSEIEWQILAQHYGLPTQLLDWTESPLIALYFAVSEKPDSQSDACLWALSPSKLNAQHADPANPGASQAGLRDFKEPIVQAIAMKAAGVKDKAIGRRLFPHESSLPPLPKVVALAAAEMDERIVAQIGRFTLHAVDGSLDDSEVSRAWLSKFIIPACSKKKLKALLQMMGTERWNLFPDLQSLADGLKQREYR